MSQVTRLLLRVVPPGGSVLVEGPVPDAALAALAVRGDLLTAADHGAGVALATRLGRATVPVVEAEVAVVRPVARVPLPRSALVVTDVLLAGPDGTDLEALAVLADAAERRVRTEHLGLDDEGGVRWVATWRRADEIAPSDRAAAVVLGALTGALDLLEGERVAVGEELTRAQWQVGDRNERLRAAERAVSVSQASVERLTAALATPRDGSTAGAEADRGPVSQVVRSLLSARRRSTTPGADAPAARPAAPLTALPGQASGVRVAVLGSTARGWCEGAVRIRPVTDPPTADAPLTAGHDHLEALLVGPDLPDGWSRADGHALLAAAAAAGAPRLGLHTTGVGVTWFDGHVDVEITPSTDAGGGGARRVGAHHPVDARTVTPSGFLRLPPRGVAVAPHGPLAPGTAEALRAAVADVRGLDVPEVLVHAPEGEHLDGLPVRGLPPLTVDDLSALLGVLHQRRGVLDHPGLHPDPETHARWLATLALARVPVLLAVPLPATVAGLLGKRLADVLAATTGADLLDPVARERRTVLALRAAWPVVTPRGLWERVLPAVDLPPPRRPSVSMVLATNRPDHLLHAVGQAAAQTWSRRELVVVLHGEAFDGGWESRVVEHAAGLAPDLPVVTRRADAGLPLGAVLDVGCEAASGRFVTKVDDDDWYSPDHLVDLLAARAQSGGHIVGKGAEFTYLAELDLTIRRMADGGESSSRSLAGGTFLLARDDLWALGGWPHVPRFVDQRLLDALLEAGGTIHRTHGFGFVLNRHGTGHTWDADADYFLRQAVTQHRGLALDVAAVAD